MLALKVHLSQALVEHLLGDAVGEGEASLLAGDLVLPSGPTPPSRADGSPLTVPRALLELAAVPWRGPGRLSQQHQGSRRCLCGTACVPAAGLDTALAPCQQAGNGSAGSTGTVGAGSVPAVVMGLPPHRVQDLALRWWQAAGSQQVDGECSRTVVSPGCSLPVGRSPAGVTTASASGRECQGGQGAVVPPQGTRWGLSWGRRQLPFCCPSLPPPCSPATALLFGRGPVPSQHPKALSLLKPHRGGLGSPQSVQEPEATLGSVSPWEGEQDLGGFRGHNHAWEWETPQPWDFTLASLAPVAVGALVRFQSEQTVGLGRQVPALVPHPGRRLCKPCVMLGPSQPCRMRYQCQGAAAPGWRLWGCCPCTGDTSRPCFTGPP